MITSGKNDNKKTQKTDRQKPTTNCENKAIKTKSHKEAYTQTLTKRAKGKKNISIYKKKNKGRE